MLIYLTGTTRYPATRCPVLTQYMLLPGGSGSPALRVDNVDIDTIPPLSCIIFDQVLLCPDALATLCPALIERTVLPEVRARGARFPRLSGQLRYLPTLSAYARPRRCPVLPWRMRMGCPVLA
eukprot:1270175-Rhodomonas_salina.1